MSEPWHQGSRFWRIAPLFVLLAAALSVYFDEPGVFTGPLITFLGGAGAQTAARHYRKTEDLP